MNMPARFDSLIWMASPMLAWAQSEAPRNQAPEAKSVPAQAAKATRPRRKPEKR